MIKAIYFHANASKTEGSGHLMRMYALAEEAKSQNIDTYLIGKISDVSWLTPEFISKVFVGVFSDATKVSRDLADCILIWDTYRLNSETQEILRLPFSRRFLIADVATPTQHADGVILLENSNKWKIFLSATGIQYFEGKEYVPIRKSHQVGNNFSPSENSNSCRALIFSGGIDFRSFVLPLSQYILDNFPLIKLVTISNSERRIENNRIEQRQATQDFDRILDQSDLVITSASSSIYEVLSRRVPSGFVVTAPNQLSNRDFLLQHNLSLEVGSYQGNEFLINKKVLENLLTDSSTRRLLQKNSLKLVDGLGSRRIINAVIDGL